MEKREEWFMLLIIRFGQMSKNGNFDENPNVAFDEEQKCKDRFDRQ